MSERNDFLIDFGEQFQAVAEGIFGAAVSAMNTLCGGRLQFIAPAVSAGKKQALAAFSGELVAVLCEAAGRAAGPISIIFDIESARALAALMMGAEPPADAAELQPDELDALKEMSSSAASTIAANLREATKANVSASVLSVKIAPDAGQLMDMLSGEQIFIAADGKIAGKNKTLLIACGLDVCKGIVKSAEPRAEAAPQAAEPMPNKVERILKIPVPVIVVLAEKSLTFKEVLSMNEGTVLEFEKNNAEPLMLLVNDRKIGLGRVVKVGERFGLRIEDIGDPEEIVSQLR